jgi:hypothetical protein
MADWSKKNIQEVEIGDVLKWETSNNTVLAFHRPLKSEWVIYGFNGEKAFVTAEHPFMTTEWWKSIDPDKTKQENIGITVTQLEVWDILITENGSKSIKSIESKQVPETTPLYNFILDWDHTYIADGYLVHNKAACGDIPGRPCLDMATHLFAVVGGDVHPVYCGAYGTIDVYHSTPQYIPWCWNIPYKYKGCYSHNGPTWQPGIKACWNTAP